MAFNFDSLLSIFSRVLTVTVFTRKTKEDMGCGLKMCRCERTAVESQAKYQVIGKPTVSDNTHVNALIGSVFCRST